MNLLREKNSVNRQFGETKQQGTSSTGRRRQQGQIFGIGKQVDKARKCSSGISPKLRHSGSANAMMLNSKPLIPERLSFQPTWEVEPPDTTYVVAASDTSARTRGLACSVTGLWVPRYYTTPLLYYTVLYYTILYYTILYYTILYFTILCYTMYSIVCYTISYCIRLNFIMFL